MPLGTGAINHDRRRGQAPAAAALIALLLLAVPLAAQQWGQRPYEQEKPEYFALVKQLEREANGLLSRIRQVRGETDAYLGRFSEAERSRLVQEYERQADYHNRNRRFQDEYDRERAAKGLYDDARAAFSAEQEALPEVRANLWTKNVAWRRQVVAARQAQLALLESRHVVIQGLVGFDWDEFWEDTAGDVLYVYKEVLTQYPQDVFQCLLDTGSAQIGSLLGASVGSQPLVASAPMPLIPDLVADVGQNCLIGSGFKALVNAFESAWKKQFLDRMKARGVLEGVAEFWWDEIIAARLPEDSTLAQKLARSIADQAQKTGAQAVETYASTVTTQALASRELPQLRQRYQALVSSASPPSRADLTGQMLKTAQQGGEQRAGELMQAAKLVVDYGQKAAELYANSATFSEVETNEVARYRRVVDCLTSRGDAVDAPAVIAVLRLDASGFAGFLRQCAAAPPAPATGGPDPGADLQRIAELLERLRGLGATTRDGVGRAEAGCASARAELSASASRLAEAQARLAQLEVRVAERGRTAAPSALAQARALETEAYAAAGQVVEAKQRVEATESQACTAADQAAAATSAAQRTQGLTTAATAAGQAEVLRQVAADAAARASAAAQKLTALLETARVTSPAPDRAAELTALASELTAAEEAVASADRASESAARVQAELARSRSEAAGLHTEARRLLDPRSSDPQRGRERVEIDAILGQLQALGAGLGACAGEIPVQVAGPKAALAALAPRLEALRRLAQPSGGAADEIAALAGADANARASADTAEIFAAAAETIAQRARACRDRAQTSAQAPLPSASAGAGTGAGASGWTAGEVRSVSPASAQPPSAPAGPDAASHIGAATAAAEACRYPEAASHADRAAAAAPGHPWVVANQGKLRDLAERQRAAVEAMNAGSQALQAKDFKSAGRFAETVQQLAPRCMDGIVSGWMDAINRDARAAQAQSWQGGQNTGRQTAGALLPGLIDVLNKSIEAQNRGQTPSAGTATTGGSGAGSPAGSSAQAAKADPCETRATYLNKWNPTPRCDCPGYGWNGYKCVPGKGSGGASGSTGGSGRAGGAPESVDVYVLESARTCCKGLPGWEGTYPNAGPDEVPYRLHIGSASQTPGAKVLRGGFPSDDAAKQWVCSHKIRRAYHWIRNVARISGVLVSETPCTPTMD